MTAWNRRIDLGLIDLSARLDAEEITLEQAREQIAKVLRADRDEAVRDIGEQIAYADSIEELDDWLEDLYDYGDRERVWVE